jgi:hypothetical protein
VSTDGRPYTVVEARVAADRAVVSLVVPGHGLGAGMAHHPNIPMRYREVYAANAQDAANAAAAATQRRDKTAHLIQGTFAYAKGPVRRSARVWAATFLLRLHAKAGATAALGERDDAAYAKATATAGKGRR